jgi:hypothetical protein
VVLVVSASPVVGVSGPPVVGFCGSVASPVSAWLAGPSPS